jgi:hypothetical protein
MLLLKTTGLRNSVFLHFSVEMKTAQSFVFFPLTLIGRDCIVITGWMVRDSNPSEGKRFSLLQTCQDWPWGPPSLCSGYRGSFLGVKWSGCSIDHPPPSSTKIENGWSCTSTSPLCLLWHITGLLMLKHSDILYVIMTDVLS